MGVARLNPWNYLENESQHMEKVLLFHEPRDPNDKIMSGCCSLSSPMVRLEASYSHNSTTALASCQTRTALWDNEPSCGPQAHLSWQIFSSLPPSWVHQTNCHRYHDMVSRLWFYLAISWYVRCLLAQIDFHSFIHCHSEEEHARPLTTSRDILLV